MKQTKKLGKKLICSLLILLTILPNLLQLVSFASTDINEAYIQEKGNCGLHLQYLKNGKTWSYVICTMVTYNYNGKEYPAYCLNSDLPGVGEYDAYTVDINSVLDNVQIWRVIKNSYPYKSPADIGVENEMDAFVATKQAVYCILYGYNPSTRYRGGDARGTAIANAIVRLVNNARNGNETPANAGVKVNKSDNITENGEYYVQKYNVTTAVECSQYTITSTAGLPSGAKVTDLSGNEKNTFGSGEEFQIMIPKTAITSDVDVTIAVQAKCKTYPIFYGKSRIPGMQDYAVTFDPFGDSEGIGKLNIKAEGQLTFYKVSTDNNIWTGTLKGQGVPNATYTIKKSNGEEVKEVKTDNNGNINVTLPVGSYTIQETASPNYFIEDSNVYSFTIAYMGNNVTVNVNEDVVKGGFFSANKKASLNNVWTGHKVGDSVAGATYGIYKSDGTLVTKNKSDENGVIFEKYKLELGDYYMQEIEPAPYFQLDTTKYEFTVEENEQKIELEVKNRSVEGGYVNIFKKAGDNNLWTETIEGEGVPNATYRIESLTVDGWYVDVTTNKEGKIVEKDFTTDNLELLLGKYKIYEISSPEGWKLNDEERYFEIDKNEESIIIDLTEIPETAGKVKVHKTASDTNYWLNVNKGEPIGNAKYTIYDLDGNEIVTLTTNEKGDSETVLLKEGSYFIKETYCPEKWKLNEEEVYFTVEENEQEFNFDFTDEPEEAGFVNVNKTSLEDNYWTGGKKGEAIEGVKFELRDEKGNVLLTLVTDKNGQFSEDIMLNKGKYYLWEVEAPEFYKINEEPELIEITENGQKVTIDITDEVEIGGFFDFTKTTSDDNQYTGEKKGAYIANAVYRLENDTTGEVIADLKTNENGTIEEKVLLKEGKYRIYEIEAPNEFYLLDKEVYYFEITKNGQAVHFDFEDEPVKTELDVEKTGIIQAQPNDEIRYDFNIVANNSNVSIDNFTLIDDLPYEYIDVTKLFTGIYSDDVNINVFYKTNLSEDYILYKENLSSKVNNYIDFESIDLKEGEYITNFKMEFGTVPANFKAETTPFMFAKVKATVKGDDVWTNHVSLTGTFFDVQLEDKDEWTTKSYEKKLTIKKLPRTGM